jgi:hypothetical protein
MHQMDYYHLYTILAHQHLSIQMMLKKLLMENSARCARYIIFLSNQLNQIAPGKKEQKVP